MRLAARRGSRLRPPRLDRLVGKPDGQAAPLPQRSVILRPVRDPISGFRDAMAVFSMVFEPQGECSREMNGLPRCVSSRVRPQPGPGPCNNLSVLNRVKLHHRRDFFGLKKSSLPALYSPMQAILNFTLHPSMLINTRKGSVLHSLRGFILTFGQCVEARDPERPLPCTARSHRLGA